MYQYNKTVRNKHESQHIDAKCKNKHAKSRKKMWRRSSNSLKQEFRNGSFNLQLFTRLHTTKRNEQYSLQKYLKSHHIYDDIQMILTHQYIATENIEDEWQCTRCTFININVDRLSHCKICHNENNYWNDSNSNSNSAITTYSSLSSYISHSKTSPIKRKKTTKKYKKPAETFKFDDENYKKFKKYMKKRKTSIIAYKPLQNNTNWNNGPKMEKRKKSANKLFSMYKTLHFSQNKKKQQIMPIIKNIMSFVPKKHTKIVLPQTSANTQCKVCYCDKSDGVELVTMSKYCSHCMICTDCFIRYLSISISDEKNIFPWLLCPAQNCKAAINKDLLLKYVSINDLYKFAALFLYKHLQRTSFWIDCPDGYDRKCKFGWIVFEKAANMKLKCEVCGCLKEERMENVFDDLLSSGTMKECPQCSYPAIKDYGMCNVMHCGKCFIFWNWRTKEMGSSSVAVKEKARSKGNLWEPGELSYQQNLQQNDLTQFIALLARNGIKYDPNYRRGN